MSLQVWLPLVRDLNNQGLADITVTNNGATLDSNGKLGGCYSFDGVDDKITLSNLPNPKNISVAFWFKRSANTGTRQFLFTAWNGVSIELDSAGNVFGKVQSNGGETGKAIGTALTTDSGWIHVVYTFEDALGGKIYINGSLIQNSPSNYSILWSTTSGNLGYWSNYVNGKFNDFRIYDHALSAKEVKEISKGLVAHYTLGDRYASDNLIINGFGELGSEGWANNNISTTEIPSADSNIKASYYNNNYTDIILINPNHTYTISGYVKSTGDTSGTTYPSIYPYDRDLKYINYYNSTVGFSTAWSTTLSQPLNTGDTVIHATDLSTWSTATNNHFYHVAIFGYKDSFGTVYDDFVYTADSPSFGSYSDKSNLNKTNNTITLKSAYTGAPRPAGTKICQATEGATYYYPWGGIALSSIQDWVFKTATFTPKDDGRLKACKYIRWNTYYSCYIAGNKLVDNTDTDRTIYDCSGYNNHGQTWAYDDMGDIEISSSTARYSVSTFINSENNTTSTASGTQMIYCPCALTTPNYLTVAFWCKPIAGYSGTTGQGQFALTMNDCGISAATDYNTAPMHHRDSQIDMNTSGNTHKTIGITFTANEWHHYAIVYDGRYGRVYKDGVAGNTLDMGSNVSLASMKAIVIGYSHAGGVIRSNKSLYSDFRIYVTALSADDILELYQTSASIDKDGNMYAYEFNEV